MITTMTISYQQRMDSKNTTKIWPNCNQTFPTNHWGFPDLGITGHTFSIIASLQPRQALRLPQLRSGDFREARALHGGAAKGPNPPRVFLVGAAVWISSGVFSSCFGAFFLRKKKTAGRNETRHVCDWSAQKLRSFLKFVFLVLGSVIWIF